MVVSLFLLTKFFAAGSLAAAGCCCLLEIAMVVAIRRGMNGWEPARFQRDIRGTFRSHRRFYPGSPLRAAFVASSFLLGGCIAALIVIHRVALGM
jgi:hypothetical protein